eukprot:6438481-Prymnesium_polylepis.2
MMGRSQLVPGISSVNTAAMTLRAWVSGSVAKVIESFSAAAATRETAAAVRPDCSQPSTA